MTAYVLDFRQIDQTKLSLVGGKGLNLGELSQIQGIHVPPGFCITTAAYEQATAGIRRLGELLDRLAVLTASDRVQLVELSAQIRAEIERVAVPEDLQDQVLQALASHGPGGFYAVRSSATAEDLPGASFAGQQDTYLNVADGPEILQYVVKCWASLFTDRAVTYRIQNGYDHRKVSLAVVIQRMVLSEASGIMFTADPMTSDRRTLSIDAGFGLGEAMVSGLVNPDIYKVRDGKIAEKRIGAQAFEIRAVPGGGTAHEAVDAGRQRRQTLSDEQILELAAIGKRIQAHFGSPQDIEWCYSDGRFHIVQSRPVTTLFPIPQSPDPTNPRVYLSLGHLQMMTDAMKPLGMHFFGVLAGFSVDIAGARLYADITHDLSSLMGRQRLVMATGKQDPLIQSAVKNLLSDKAFMASLPSGRRNLKGGVFTFASLLETLKVYRRNDPSIIEQMLAGCEREVRETGEQLAKLSGARALAFIEQDLKKMVAMAFNPQMLGAIIVAMLAGDAVSRSVAKWLGEKQVADILAKSVDHNVTTEMGLALCDVADAARKHPAVVAFLAGEPSDATFFADLEKLPGGAETCTALRAFLEKYGMRCPGEIDISRPRWAEKPTQLLPMLLSDIRILGQGGHVAKFENGRREAAEKEREIIRRLEALPGGSRKAKKIRRLISLLRNFTGCREYPKYYIIRRFQVYKTAILKEADRLVTEGALENPEDIFYLYFDELKQAVGTGAVDRAVIEARKADFIRYEKLTPPRIITSKGYVPPCRLSAANMPEGALGGIAVSIGVVEGRARVVTSVAEARLEEGDILVTQFTDPSWTPLFVAVKGLVTEVGGFTTHGAVITREYGLPAVVGVENATRLIKDGQRIRVNGTEGYVELL